MKLDSEGNSLRDSEGKVIVPSDKEIYDAFPEVLKRYHDMVLMKKEIAVDHSDFTIIEGLVKSSEMKAMMEEALKNPDLTIDDVRRLFDDISGSTTSTAGSSSSSSSEPTSKRQRSYIFSGDENLSKGKKRSSEQIASEPLESIPEGSEENL